MKNGPRPKVERKQEQSLKIGRGESKAVVDEDEDEDEDEKFQEKSQRWQEQIENGLKWTSRPDQQPTRHQQSTPAVASHKPTTNLPLSSTESGHLPRCTNQCSQNLLSTSVGFISSRTKSLRSQAIRSLLLTFLDVDLCRSRCPNTFGIDHNSTNTL